jgi:hypothetical protein
VGLALAAVSVPPLEGPCLLNLQTLNLACPQHFYLADTSFEKLHDSFATVEGVRLPLHSALLAAQVEQEQAGQGLAWRSLHGSMQLMQFACNVSSSRTSS